MRVTISGRPLGLGRCSNVAKPQSLKQWTHSYTIVGWQPTRSATSTTGRPHFGEEPISPVPRHAQGPIPQFGLQQPSLASR